MMNAWYVIHTKHKKDEEVASFLRMKGLEIFQPFLETFSQRNGKMEKDLKPLFPNYIFGRFDLDRDYSLVRWARGVKKLLGFGYPATVSEDVIEVIKKRTDTDGIVRRNPVFEPNDRVRIRSGPLKDLLGVFERWTSECDRVKILLNLLGYQPSAELHFSMIEKVA